MKRKFLPLNSLMKYLRDNHSIKICGGSQKKQLRNIGYYHGYKGYRYFNYPQNRILYKDFKELFAVYEFDMALKSIFYSQIMFIETALKNIALQILLDSSKSSNFNDIYSSVLTSYNEVSHKEYANAFKKHLELRTKIYSKLTEAYKNKRVVQHFYKRGDAIPIWAIFEVITLGEFGVLVESMNLSARKQLSVALSLRQSYDTGAHLFSKIIYTIKDLRNAIAHNQIIFDNRFQNSKISALIPQVLKIETNINNVDFSTIIDFVILVTFLLKKLSVSKRDILKFISSIEQSIELLRLKIPTNIFNQIVHTNSKTKLQQLKIFVKL